MAGAEFINLAELVMKQCMSIMDGRKGIWGEMWSCGMGEKQCIRWYGLVRRMPKERMAKKGVSE